MVTFNLKIFSQYTSRAYKHALAYYASTINCNTCRYMCIIFNLNIVLNKRLIVNNTITFNKYIFIYNNSMENLAPFSNFYTLRNIG